MTENQIELSGMSPDSIKDNVVVDVDVHTSYRDPKIQRDLAKHMMKPWRNQLNPDDDYTAPYVNDGWGRTIGGRVPIDTMSVTEPEDVTDSLMKEFGVDYALINNFAAIDLLPETERVMQEMRAMNTVLLDRFLDESNDLFGLCTLSTRDPAEAAEEIDRMGDEDGIVGIFICTAGAEKPLGHPRYDIMYRAAEDNDLPIVFHGGTGGIGNFDAPVLHRGFEKFIEIHTLGHPWCQMLTLTSLIFEGTPEKFPGLNFVILEAGLGWVPYMMARMNREFGERRAEVPLLEQTPEQYIRDQFYFGPQPLGEFGNHEHMQHIVDIVGAESIMFATDHPHFDFDHPEAVDRFLQRLTPAERDMVLHANAIEVFDLEI